MHIPPGVFVFCFPYLFIFELGLVFTACKDERILLGLFPVSFVNLVWECHLRKVSLALLFCFSQGTLCVLGPGFLSRGNRLVKSVRLMGEVLFPEGELASSSSVCMSKFFL